MSERILNGNNIISEKNDSNKLPKESTIFQKSRYEAMKGGFSGLVGGVVQVIALMWLRTAVNYQYKYGGNIYETLRILYSQGGISRFYRGLPFAIIQGPLSRFGTIAANEGAIEFIRLTFTKKSTKEAIIYATALGSILSACWRALIMPIDTFKTVIQVDGTKGFDILIKRLMLGDIGCLYQGTIATSLATLVEHYFWFYIHNWLDILLKKPTSITLLVCRSAFIGFISTTISDTLSNIIRVVKTVKQSIGTDHSSTLSYIQVIEKIYKEDGLIGLFGRGLLLRLISNCIQSMLFTIVWKLIAMKIKEYEEKVNKKKT